MRINHYIKQLPGWRLGLHVRLAWCFILLVGIIAILGPLIANEKPFYCKLEGAYYFPMFSSTTEAGLSAKHPLFAPVDWSTTPFESIVRAPIPYSHFSIDLKTGANVSPFDPQPVPIRMRHWLGTDSLGRDVLSGMIRGCRISLLIGLGSMLLALIIGVMFGSIAAYWGNKGKRVSWLQILFSCLLLFILLIVLYLPIGWIHRLIISMLILTVGIYSFWKLDDSGKKNISLPLDNMIMGVVSIIDGFPAMFIIIILVSILPVKGWLVILLLIAL